MTRPPRRPGWLSVGVWLCANLAACRPASVCNGHRELCGRGYDRVAFPGTHDAYSVSTRGFQFSDQTYPMSRQLADGVRVLHLEVLPYQGGASLCHGLCGQGNQLLSAGLTEVEAFLAAHPEEVVTLLVESNALTTDTIAAAFEASGLVRRVHAQAAGAPWPTLQKLVDHGDRVVVFYVDVNGVGGTSFPWLLPRWSWTWETPWDNEAPVDFGRCNADRGTEGNALYTVDTYLEDELIPSIAHAELVNNNPFLIERLLSCGNKTGAFVNFAMVNYYQVGDLFLDVDVLNGFASAPATDLTVFPPASWSGDAGADGG